MQRELELKLELSKSDVERLRSELPEPELGIGPPTREKLRSVYYDTPGHDLHAAGISLRLRSQNGGWLQTVKADQHVEDGISNPVQLEALVETEEPDLAKIADKKIKRVVKKAAKGTMLRPIFETVIHRTTRTIKAEGSEIELAVDEGEVRAGDATREVREAELELKAGDAEGLLLAAEKLLAGHEIKLSKRSKAERGYQLALQKKATSAAPEKARPIPIGRKDTCAKGFGTILQSAVRQILVNREAVLQTDDPNGAHQLRIGLRRLRAALRGLRPLADRSSLRAFERSARDIGRCVGALRDADVLISGIHAPVEAAAPDKAGFSELLEMLTRERERRRDEVRAALRGPASTKLQLYLSLWPRTLAENPKLEKPVTGHAAKVLNKAWKKADKLGRNLGKLDVEHRHEMRKALKRLRYQAEFFAPLFSKRETERFVERLKALQDVFGYVNDVRMAPQLVELQKRSNAGVAAACAASYTVGHHEAHAADVWRSAGEAWNDLKRARRFWD
jgi:inorganic triphosphatase YgiF